MLMEIANWRYYIEILFYAVEFDRFNYYCGQTTPNGEGGRGRHVPPAVKVMREWASCRISMS